MPDGDVVLTFNNDVRRQSFNVTIIDDSLFEPTEEEFTLKLVLMQSLPNVEIDPESADITIVDDDGMNQCIVSMVQGHIVFMYW